MKTAKKILCVLLAAMMSFFAVSCEKKEETVNVVSNIDDESIYQNLGENTLWLSAYGFDTFNPIATTSKSVADCAYLVFDSLFYLDANLEARGVLANNYTVSADKKTYTVTLNTNFKFHDGSGFSSADVVYTINEIKRLGQGSMFYEYVENIDSVSANGADSVIIKISSPEPLFVNNLVFPIVKNNTPSSAKIDSPIGTGPYKFVKTNLVRAMYFEENENYAGERAAENRMKNAVVTFVPDRSTQTYALEARRSDAACVTAKELAENNPNGAVKTLYYNNRRLTYIGINSLDEVLSSAALRRAISCATDRTDIINSVFYGNGEAVLMPFCKNGFMYPEKYKDASKKPIDVENEMLSDGWVRGSDGIWKKETDVGGKTKTIRASFTLAVNYDNQQRVQVAERICDQLLQSGIEAKTVKTDFDTYKTKIDTNNYEAYIGEVYMDNSYRSDLLFGAEARYSVCFSEKLNSAQSRKKTALGKEETVVAYEELADCLAEQMPVVCLYFGCDAMVINNTLNGADGVVSGSEFANLRSWTKSVN